MPAAPRRRPTKRCSFVDEQGRRCRRIGFGRVPLCRACALRIEADLEDADPIAAFFEGVDRLLSRRQTPAVLDFVSEMLSDHAASQSRYEERFTAWATGAMRAAVRHPRMPPPPPPPPPPIPEVPEVDQRELDARLLLGFAPSMRLDARVIKARRRELALRNHPDKQTDPAAQAAAQRRMSQINAAADYLVGTLEHDGGFG